MIKGHDCPAACRMWNFHHLWGRLRDFYQVGHWEDLTRSLATCPCEGGFLSVGLFQEELQLLILSPPPDLQTLGCDPLSGAASHLPSTLCPCPHVPP